MYWTGTQTFYYTQAFAFNSLNRLAYSLLPIRVLSRSEEISYVRSVAFPNFTTATSHVLALITICNRQDWLNITTPEKKDMNSSFSGLFCSLPSV